MQDNVACKKTSIYVLFLCFFIPRASRSAFLPEHWAPGKKEIPKRNIITETAYWSNKIINKQGKSIMFEFFYKL